MGSPTPPHAPRPTGEAAEGHGLIGMRERAALYNGTVIAGPELDGGWTVDTRLDLTPLPDLDGGRP